MSQLSGAQAFGIGIAIASGTLAALEQRKRDKALIGAGRESQRRINEVLTQRRVNALLNTRQLAIDAQRAAGAATNQLPEGLSALEAVSSRIISGASRDQFAIDEELRRRETAATAEKRNIVNRINLQTRAPFFAFLTAAIPGLSTGLQVAGAFQSAAGEAAQTTAAADLLAGQAGINAQTAGLQQSQLELLRLQTEGQRFQNQFYVEQLGRIGRTASQNTNVNAAILNSFSAFDIGLSFR